MLYLGKLDIKDTVSLETRLASHYFKPFTLRCIFITYFHSDSM